MSRILAINNVLTMQASLYNGYFLQYLHIYTVLAHECLSPTQFMLTYSVCVMHATDPVDHLHFLYSSFESAFHFLIWMHSTMGNVGAILSILMPLASKCCLLIRRNRVDPRVSSIHTAPGNTPHVLVISLCIFGDSELHPEQSWTPWSLYLIQLSCSNAANKRLADNGIQGGRERNCLPAVWTIISSSPVSNVNNLSPLPALFKN